LVCLRVSAFNKIAASSVKNGLALNLFVIAHDTIPDGMFVEEAECRIGYERIPAIAGIGAEHDLTAGISGKECIYVRQIALSAFFMLVGHVRFFQTHSGQAIAGHPIGDIKESLYFKYNIFWLDRKPVLSFFR
jgi:hypothetical protein